MAGPHPAPLDSTRRSIPEDFGMKACVCSSSSRWFAFPRVLPRPVCGLPGSGITPPPGSFIAPSCICPVFLHFIAILLTHAYVSLYESCRKRITRLSCFYRILLPFAYVLLFVTLHNIILFCLSTVGIYFDVGFYPPQIDLCFLLFAFKQRSAQIACSLLHM